MTPYYQDDFITIYHGDCLEILPGLVGIDSIVTDPPYGIKRFEKGFGYTRFKGYGVEKIGIIWDKKPNNKAMSTILNTGKYHIIWGANNFNLPPSESFLVWNKQQTVDNFASAELAYCDIPGLTAKIFNYSIHRHNQTEKDHPTQKPTPLMLWCLGFLPDDSSLICDPYTGSGSTLVAAKQLGLKAIGIEIVESYCEVAARRVSQTSVMFPEVRVIVSAEQAPLFVEAA